MPGLFIPGPEGLGWPAYGPYLPRTVHLLSGGFWVFASVALGEAGSCAVLLPASGP